MSLPSDLAAPPPADTPPPEALRAALHQYGLSGAALHPVWRNGVGGLTFSVASNGRGSAVDYYAKWNPLASGESLSEETTRLRWIEGRHPAPRVVELITTEREEIMITQAMPGESAVSERWKQRPDTVLFALGAGLRQLHSVAIDDCPFEWSVSQRVEGYASATALSSAMPDIDKLVLCQGDPCAPNTLLADDGTFLAHVDLARLGVADRWADLAVMTMSFEWNYQNYDETVFWDAYGVAPDRERINFYRELWNAT